MTFEKKERKKERKKEKKQDKVKKLWLYYMRQKRVIFLPMYASRPDEG